MTSLPQIHIIGAGLSGLTLARCLRNKGITAIIFEKNPSPARHNYGMTLKRKTCRTLLKVLDLDARSFTQNIAVDSGNGGQGLAKSSHGDMNENGSGLHVPFRAHCGRLEMALREGLKIEWGHSLEDVSREGSQNVLEFKDKENVHAKFVIDTSAIHSKVRKSLLQRPEPTVLPYVCFRGTRRIEGPFFKELYQPHFKDGNVIETKKNSTLLQVWINGYQQEKDVVEISYVYSRPTRDNDPLHRPGRAPGESADISEAFFDEVARLPVLKQPFKDTFDAGKIKDDRILHWLMRTSLTPLDELNGLLESGVVFIGDCAHSMPILGSDGAHFAIEDAVELAEVISENGINDLRTFYQERHGAWEAGIMESEKRLKKMHSTSTSSL